MSSYFVTGATGFIGSHLVNSLLDEGHEVRALIRKTSDIDDLRKSENLEYVVGDLTIPGLLDSCWFENVDAVFHLAGVVTDWAPFDRYYRVHVVGTQRLLEMAKKSQVKRFVYLSTIDVLDKGQGEILTEETSYTHSKSSYISTKARAERLVIKAGDDGWFEIAVLRPTWAYGVGDKTLLPEIAYQLQKKSMILVGSRDVVVPLVHVDSIVWALKELARNPVAKNRTYDINDGNMTWGSLMDFVSDKLHFPRVKTVLPYWLSMAIARCMEFFGRIFKIDRRPLLTKTAVEMLAISVRVDTSRIERDLHFKPAISLSDGLDQVALWLAGHKLSELRSK